MIHLKLIERFADCFRASVVQTLSITRLLFDSHPFSLLHGYVRHPFRVSGQSWRW